jgi:hypothetical protein
LSSTPTTPRRPLQPCRRLSVWEERDDALDPFAERLPAGAVSEVAKADEHEIFRWHDDHKLSFMPLRVEEIARAVRGKCLVRLAGAGRSLASCMTDLDPMARRLISVHPGVNEVIANGFGVATATAHYEKGFGCSLRN